MEGTTETTSAGWLNRLLDQGVHPHTRVVADHWLSIHPAPDVLPGRRHFDPLDLPAKVWPNLCLTERLDDPFDMRYRLIGTAVVEHLGEDRTGRTVRESAAGFANRTIDQVLHHYRVVCEQRRPDYANFPILLRKRGYAVDVERIHLPLAANGCDVDMVLTSLANRGRSADQALAKTAWM